MARYLILKANDDFDKLTPLSLVDCGINESAIENECEDWEPSLKVGEVLMAIPVAFAVTGGEE